MKNPISPIRMKIDAMLPNHTTRVNAIVSSAPMPYTKKLVLWYCFVLSGKNSRTAWISYWEDSQLMHASKPVEVDAAQDGTKQTRHGEEKTKPAVHDHENDPEITSHTSKHHTQ